MVEMEKAPVLAKRCVILEVVIDLARNIYNLSSRKSRARGLVVMEEIPNASSSTITNQR